MLITSMVSPTLAQETVTEQGFLAVLNPGHPALVALEGELTRAAGAHRAAGLLGNPEFVVEHEGPNGAADQTTLKLGWKPPLDGQRGAAMDATEATLEAAKAKLEWARLSLRADFRALYADWAIASERTRVLRAQFRQVAAVSDRFRQRAERGEESGLAAKRLALAASEVRGQLAAAEAVLAHTRAEALALRADLPADVQPTISPLPPIPAAVNGLERPDVLAQRNSVRAHELERRLAGRFFEFPTLEVGWTRIEEQNSDVDGPFVGLSLELPLFDRNQGRRSTASQLIDVEEARLSVLESRAQVGVKAALEAYATLREHALEVERTIDEAADVSDAAWAAFSAGESSLTDLLETLRSVLGSQLAGLELLAKVHAAHRELELQAGRPLLEGETR